MIESIIATVVCDLCNAKFLIHLDPAYKVKRRKYVRDLADVIEDTLTDSFLNDESHSYASVSKDEPHRCTSCQDKHDKYLASLWKRN